MQKSILLTASPGWGTHDIGTVVDQWLDGKKITILIVCYNTHTEKKTDYYGCEKDATVHTALIIYTEN